MRLNGVVGKALVVMAMACLGWLSPAGAEMEDEFWCDIWLCVGMEEPCDLEDIETWCSVACPGSDGGPCKEDEGCNTTRARVKCVLD